MGRIFRLPLVLGVVQRDLLLDRLGLGRTAGSPRRGRVWQTLHAMLAVIAVALAIRTGLLSKTMPAVEAKPVGALAFMEEHKLQGNVLSDFGWADYLLFHYAVRTKIFIESIFEAYYPHQVQSDFAAINDAESGAARKAW